MQSTIIIVIFLATATFSAPIDTLNERTLEEDVDYALYNNKKVSYDLDVLAARTSILGLELKYTAFNLMIDIETLLYELLFTSDADRVVGEINRTAESVLTNVGRLDEAIVRLDSSVLIIEQDLQDNLDALKSDQLLLESYISNFNLTYDIGKDNIILSTNFILLTLQNELEGLNEPEVDIVFNLAQKIKDVLMTEQDYLDNARLSFDRNSVAHLEALKTVVDQLPADDSGQTKGSTTLPTKTTSMSYIPTTSTTSMSPVPTTSATMSIIPVTSTTSATTMSPIPTTSPTTTMSYIPTTSPTSTMSYLPPTSTTPTTESTTRTMVTRTTYPPTSEMP